MLSLKICRIEKRNIHQTVEGPFFTIFWAFDDRIFNGGRAKTAEETRFPGEKMVVKAPMDGIVLPLEQLPDETFAAAILGPGCGIEPTGGTVYALV